MAESYTYADLRFVKGPATRQTCQTPGPPREPYLAGSGTVYMSDTECTYANVTCSARGVSEDRAAEGAARTEPDKLTEGKSWNKHILLILAVICLVILVTCVVLGVQLILVSKDRGTQKRNFLQSIQMQTETLEDTETRLRETVLKLDQAKDDLENSQKMMNYFNNSWNSALKALEESKQKLSESQKNATETQSRLSSAEGSLNGIKDLFAAYEDAECCQKGWTLLAGSCFYFSEEKNLRYLSQRACESEDAWLVGNRIRDPAVEEYMKNKLTKEYWVGLKASYSKDFNWEDPRRSKKDLTNYMCAITARGKLEHKSCGHYSGYTYQYVCEKEPMKIMLQRGEPVLPRKGP